MVDFAYTLAMPKPETHLYEVTLDARALPVAEDGTIDFQMPAWTPGSYLVREYARHVQDFEARSRSGKTLAWTRVDKQTWRVNAAGVQDVRVTYRVYANDLGVRTSHLDATHGFADGTSVFMYVPTAMDAPATIRVRSPRAWVVDSAMPRVPGKRDVFRADDYYHVADSTFEIGTHRRFSFKVDGRLHRVALYGHGNEDEARLVKDLETIVREEIAMMGAPPYDEYLFIIHLVDKAGGGLEHRASNTSMVDRWTFQPAKRYEDFLSLEAHEFYHVWNVKGVRPASFEKYDYSQEVYTTLLWAMEGVTAYYDHLVLVRAGLISEKRYRHFLGETITKFRKQPGRLRLSLEDSSKLAWVKLYKMDENWLNSGISYYLKGELVALVLDLAIRKRTKGRKNLDDVMRALYAKYPAGSGGLSETPVNTWRAVLEAETGVSWLTFWRKYIAGTDEVDFERYFASVGWRLIPEGAVPKREDDAKGEYVGVGAWLGADVISKNDRVVVKAVYAGSPAEAAGLAAQDEVVAVGGYRVREPDFLAHRLQEAKPGDAVDIAFFRRDALVNVRATLAKAPPAKWLVKEAPRAPAAAKKARAAWLAPYAGKRRTPVAGGKAPRKRAARTLVEERGQ